MEFMRAHEDEPNFFEARFDDLEFEFEPFSLPGTGFTGLTREILDDPDSPFSGFLDADEGFIYLEAPMRWLNLSGDTVASSLEYFQIHVAPFSSNQVDVLFESGGTFSVIPEPSSILMVLLGLGISVSLRREFGSLLSSI